MRRVASAAVFLLFACPIAVAQLCHTAAPRASGDEFRQSPCCKPFAEAVFQSDLQKVNWEVTGNAAARPYFKQGMTQYYGFNYEEALRNFRRAKQLDPSMAMASWGIALAAGPNINLGMDGDCHKLAQQESNEAVTKANKTPVTPLERALIDALPKRYDFPERTTFGAEEYKPAKDALQAYSDALGRSWEKFKGEANYGALYAESLIELHPWDVYKNRLPTSDDTKRIVDVLTDTLRDHPDAVGANHYWIHVAEAGPTPVDAKNSAKLLRTLVKASGHLMHMPSHIDLLLGEYDQAVLSNEQAAGVDVSQYKDCCSGSFNDYSKNPYCPQLYYGHYLSHNYFFGSVSATFSGQSGKAIGRACDTRAHAQNFLANEPGLQRYLTAPLTTLVVNRNWDEIALEPGPTPPTTPPKPPTPFDTCYTQHPFTPEPDGGCHILRAVWYWAQGMRHAWLNDSQKTLAQYQLMRTEKKSVKTSQPTTWGNNSAASVLDVGESLLWAHYEWLAKDIDGTIRALEQAVDAEDRLSYDEPPQWFPPARESLGGAYLVLERYALAESIFTEELALHPSSGRALYGKWRAQKKLKRDADAELTRIDFCNAWNIADFKMTEQDLWPVRQASTLSEITCPTTPPLDHPSKGACSAPPWPATLTGKCPKPPAPPAPNCPIAAAD